jgi:hypothetical protein
LQNLENRWSRRLSLLSFFVSLSQKDRRIS